MKVMARVLGDDPGSWFCWAVLMRAFVMRFSDGCWCSRACLLIRCVGDEPR